MVARILSPAIGSALAVALSLGLALALTWRDIGALVRRAAAPPVPKPVEAPAGKARGWDFWTVEMENLANELKEQRAQLKQRAEALDQREARVRASEKELARARADIDALSNQISERVVELSAGEAVNLRKLAQTYANLSPRAVVAIIREMDDATAVKILALIKPDVVGPIFEEMTKTAGTDKPLAHRAAVLSERIRVMRPPQAGAER